jgi:hypothetical protein
MNELNSDINNNNNNANNLFKKTLSRVLKQAIEVEV